MIELPDNRTRTNSSSRSITESEGVSLCGSGRSDTSFKPYTVEVRGQLTPEQKQELLDHVDEQNLPPEQKRQATEDIKKVDGWFKSVANFFKKNVKSILAFTAFVTIGIGLSIAMPSMLPVFGVLLLATLVAFVFAGDDFDAQYANASGNASGNASEKSESIDNDNDDNQSLQSEEDDDNAPSAANENHLSPANVRKRGNPEFSAPRDEPEDDRSMQSETENNDDLQEPTADFRDNQETPEGSLTQTGDTGEPDEVEAGQNAPRELSTGNGESIDGEVVESDNETADLLNRVNVMLADGIEQDSEKTGSHSQGVQTNDEDAAFAISRHRHGLKKTDGPRNPEEFKTNKEVPWRQPTGKTDRASGPGKTGSHSQGVQTNDEDAASAISRHRHGLKKTDGPRKPEKFRTNKEVPWRQPTGKTDRADGPGKIGLHSQGVQTDDEDAASATSRYRHGLKKTDGPRKPEKFRTNKEVPWRQPTGKTDRADGPGKIGLHSQGVQTDDEDAASATSRYRHGLKKTDGPRKPEKFRTNKEVPWQRPTSKAERIDDKVVEDDDEISKLLSEVSSRLIDDTEQDSDDSGIHLQDSQVDEAHNLEKHEGENRDTPREPPIGTTDRYGDKANETRKSETPSTDDVGYGENDTLNSGLANVLDVSSEDAVTMTHDAMYERARKAKKEGNNPVFLWNIKGITSAEDERIRINVLAEKMQLSGNDPASSLEQLRNACFSATKEIAVRS